MLALNNIQGEVCFFTIALLFRKKQRSCEERSLKLHSLQPLFHYGVPPLSIRADNFLLVAVINIQLS